MACSLGSRRSFGAGRGMGRLRRGFLLALCSLLLYCKVLPHTFRPCSYVLGALTQRKSMGHPRLAALLLPLYLLLIGASASAGIGCPCLPHWITRRLLVSHTVRCHYRVGGISAWYSLAKLSTLLSILFHLPKSMCSDGSFHVPSTQSQRDLSGLRAWAEWDWEEKSHKGWAVRFWASELGDLRQRPQKERSL